jgi:DNA-binding NtrC family response regulator
MEVRSQALVIDSDPQQRKLVKEVLQDDGWVISQAETIEQALELTTRRWAVIFCDILSGRTNGFQILQRFKEESPTTRVVLFAAQASALDALDATASGAYDYLLKPIGREELRAISSAIQEQLRTTTDRRLIDRRETDRRKSPAFSSDLTVIGRSQVFIEVMKTIGRVARTDLSVILSGESGTGKGLLALALHHRSKRRDMPFVAVNCGAIPAELIETELFGHVRGSFTGAERDRCGLWEEAEGGTIFLDEIAETSPAFQVKLLRAIQEGEIRRVGSNTTQKVNVRVIAASNRNLEEEVKQERFRADLFYRLNAVGILLPPLRERKEDILPLARSFAERIYSLNLPVRLSAAAIQKLEHYPWPGNIRELENAIVRAAALCDGIIRLQHLPEQIRSCDVRQDETQPHLEDQEEACGTEQGRWLRLAELEARYVVRVLERTGGNKRAAAQLLGIDRKRLDRMIRRYEIDTTNLREFSHQPLGT